MGQINKSVIHIAYSLCLVINELIDKGYSENVNIITENIFNGKMVDYIINQYEKNNISDLNLIKLKKEELLELDKLLIPYNQVINDYGINNNGLILASSVLVNVLFEEK
ncbi:hypothetical protein FDF86_06255 [Clostridium botulinum]|nr:hypothetical protein [Clostridium botulinum]